MLTRFRTFWTKAISPVAHLLLRWGVSPDTVTLVGTLGVCAGALVFYPTGHLLIGAVVITVFVFSDMLDGHMARESGQSTSWGAFLDSTLDRIGDAAVFGGLVMYYVGPGDSEVWAGFALYCLVMGSVTSYARARAESLGMEAKVGIAERSDRLAVILVATGMSVIIALPVLVPIGLVALAVASSITVVQRVLAVRGQAKAAV